jgi:hypothetical protein
MLIHFDLKKCLTFLSFLSPSVIPAKAGIQNNSNKKKAEGERLKT